MYSNNPTHYQSLKPRKFEWHIIATEQNIAEMQKNTVIAFIENYSHKQDIALSKADLKQAISKGALWLTPIKTPKKVQRLRRLKKAINVGDELHFYYNDDVLSALVPQASLIADLIDYSVWYKPYGMLSQGSKWSDHCTIARFAQQNLPNERPTFIVHRLDRAATGLILIAHSKRAARALSKMFEQHQLEKIYQIIVHGDHRKRPQPDIINSDIGHKKAQSTFTCLAYDEVTERSLIQVKIDSGRKHQIRIHAASIGMPVYGDRLHGIADEDEHVNLQLCAISLRFTCPIKQLESASDNDTSLKESFFELPETLTPQLF